MEAEGSEAVGATAARPKGREAVREALMHAALELLTQKGATFSVREVATRAEVNPALIYRHFGSKEELISATAADITTKFAKAVADGASPLQLIADDHGRIVTVLARLVLDESGQLVREHPGVAALADLAAANASDGGPSPEARTVVAGTAVLGWVLFADYLTAVVGSSVRDEAAGLHNDIVDRLLTGTWQAPVHKGS